MRAAFLAFVMLMFMVTAVPAQEEPEMLPPENVFKAYNPDIDKFGFAKNFILSLSYYGRTVKRLESEKPIGDKFSTDLKAVKILINDRTLDNTELRIAKNYLVKYAASGNALIRKVAYDTAVAYENHIFLSSRERQMWQVYYKFKSVGIPSDLNETEFKQQLESVARDRKRAALDVLGQVMMLKKIILSAQRCADENCQELALTQVERDKLVEKLDAFAGDNMTWGMKEGQGTFEASVASLREVLEDSAFSSAK